MKMKLENLSTEILDKMQFAIASREKTFFWQFYITNGLLLKDRKFWNYVTSIPSNYYRSIGFIEGCYRAVIIARFDDIAYFKGKLSERRQTEKRKNYRYHFFDFTGGSVVRFRASI
ncbi:hypothetical protein [Kamptonema formosum]|uniref:hypothetical protein n=1 Tax=Kamptonema formosum TaxID=331992 RepID=UPI001563D779|nr:hypothetical protein [Kamptonema formosum]